jgi:hypothetical protein
MFYKIISGLIAVTSVAGIASVIFFYNPKPNPIASFEKNTKWNVLSLDHSAKDKNTITVLISTEITNPSIVASSRILSNKQGSANTNIWFNGVNFSDNSETIVTINNQSYTIINTKDLSISGPECFKFQLDFKQNSKNQYLPLGVTNRITTDCKYQNLD